MPKVTCRPWVPTSVKKADRKRAALRPGAFVDQVRELVELDADEGGAEQAGDGQPLQRAVDSVVASSPASAKP